MKAGLIVTVIFLLITIFICGVSIAQSVDYKQDIEKLNYELETLKTNYDSAIISKDSEIAQLHQTVDKLNIDLENEYYKGYFEGKENISKNLSIFNSKSNLASFLYYDDTDWHLFIPEIYDCDNFAIDLINNAYDAGYFMGLVVEENSENNNDHMLCFAIVFPNLVYYVEPQTDEVWFFGYLD